MYGTGSFSKTVRARASRSWVLPLLFAFALGIVGSATAMGAPPPRQVAPGGNLVNPEASLGKKVRNRLASIPYYNVFDNLEYQVQGTTVTLSGQVLFPLSASSVEDCVKGIPGVTRIVNHVQNLQESPFDNQVRWAEYRTLFFGDSPLLRYSLGVTPQIHIVVNNGHVTLVGVVASQMDRELAYLRARTVPFVFSVRNDLKVG